MKTRTSEKTVTFRRPFVLAGLDEVLPAGDYSVETEEELVDGISYVAYRRTETVLRLHVKSGPSHLTRAMTIDPVELEAALERDAKPAEPPAGRVASANKPTRAIEPRQEEIDLRAMDRAEGEGMMAHPL